MTTHHTPHLINNPNQENTDFIHTANSKTIKHALFGRIAYASHVEIATTFNDFVTLRNMQREVRNTHSYDSLPAKLTYKTLNSPIVVKTLTFLGILLISALYIAGIDFATPRAENNPFLIFLAIAGIPVAGFVAIYALTCGTTVYDSVEPLPYFNKTQKALLKTIPVAHIPQDELDPYILSLRKVQKAAENMTQLQKQNQRHNIDMSRFAQAYDDYMEVLMFAYSNKNTISKGLFEKYMNDLDALAEIAAEEAAAVSSELEEIEQAISKELGDPKDFAKMLADIRQNETDASATAAMPLRFE